MVRVRNEAGNDTQDGEWINLHVSCHWLDVLLAKSDESIVFLINVKVLNDTFTEEVREVFETESKIFDVLLLKLGLAILTHDEWPNKSSTV